jgi:ABC-type nickel/cobalt efflux system permease component RcnA
MIIIATLFIFVIDLCMCWRKIRTLRQAHSKPNKAGLTHEQIPKCASQFSWN